MEFKRLFNGSFKIESLNRPLNIKELKVDIVSKEGLLGLWDPNFLAETLEVSLRRLPFAKIRNEKTQKIKLTKDYKNLTFVGTFTPEEYLIENLIFLNQASNRTIVKGKIDPTGVNKKRIKVWIKGDSDLQKVLLKRTRLKTYPIGLWSKGFTLEEDPLYSLNLLAKKLRFKKDIKKIKKTIKEVKLNIKKVKNEKS